MKKIFGLVAFLVLCSLGTAHAYVFDLGTDSSIDVSATSGALELQVSMNSSLSDLLLSLDAGESASVYFASIGTTETWINPDDLAATSVTAYIDFDDPLLTQTIGGTSSGYSHIFGMFQGWDLVWDDPIDISFGDGGSFTLDLSDAGYDSLGSPSGWDDIYLSITLNSESAADPVPEPATMMLLGAGLLGIAGLNARKKRS